MCLWRFGVWVEVRGVGAGSCLSARSGLVPGGLSAAVVPQESQGSGVRPQLRNVGD